VQLDDRLRRATLYRPQNARGPDRSTSPVFAVKGTPAMRRAWIRLFATVTAIDKRKALEVDLKFFGGLTREEIAGLLPASGATIERDRKWSASRA
jgi:hypothetical protein